MDCMDNNKIVQSDLRPKNCAAIQKLIFSASVWELYVITYALLIYILMWNTAYLEDQIFTFNIVNYICLKCAIRVEDEFLASLTFEA